MRKLCHHDRKKTADGSWKRLGAFEILSISGGKETVLRELEGVPEGAWSGPRVLGVQSGEMPVQRPLREGVEKMMRGPWLDAQLVRALSQCDKVVGLIPGQGTYNNQPINA